MLSILAKMYPLHIFLVLFCRLNLFDVKANIINDLSQTIEWSIADNSAGIEKFDAEYSNDNINWTVIGIVWM